VALDGFIDSQLMETMIDDLASLKPDERLDEFQGLKVIQKVDGPHFSLDAILLARFATVRRGDMVTDLGVGSGIISLILAKNTEAVKITGLEIQSELAAMACRNVKLNDLTDRIQIINGDLREKILPAEQFDLVVSNPPYRPIGSGRINPNFLKAISRHEIKCNLEDVLKSSFYLLKNRGRAAFVYRPDRIVDLITGCRRNRLEPKRLQFVYPGADNSANLVLIEAVKNSKPELEVLKPLIVTGHEIPAFL